MVPVVDLTHSTDGAGTDDEVCLFLVVACLHR
jgi:hypothetical protein